MSGEDRTIRSPWHVALVVPVIAGALAWLWADATVPKSVCALGNRLGGGAMIGLLVLMASAPAATAWQARRTRYPLTRSAAAVMVATVLGLLIVWAAYLVWYFGHNCYD